MHTCAAGGKRDSIFSTGEGFNSKVGVTGSGKGMTDYQKLSKPKMPDGSVEESWGLS